MLKTFTICAVTVTSLAACSATPQPRTASAAAPSSCVQATASRIPASPGQCSISPGRSYSYEDIERTGQTSNVGEALQMLDPAISVHH